MKKFMFAAMAALAITSCSQNEEMDAPSGKKEIGFTSVVGKTSRAAEMDLALLKTKHFKVYSYNTGTEKYGTGVLDKLIMGGVEVEFVDPNWTYEGNYYWPIGKANVQFFAYAPFGSSHVSYAATSTDTNPTITYTVPASDTQEDFVVAKTTDQTSDVDKVGVHFNHVLTQVNFSIKGEDGSTYTVTKIKISGVANKGTLKFNDLTSWTPITGTTGEYEYPIGSTNSVTGTAVATILDQTGKALMLLPQTFEAGSGAKLTISYLVTDGNGNSIYEAIDKDIDLASTGAWSAGRKMRYTLTLTSSPKSITFDTPTFEDWGEEVSETGTVPKI